MLWGSLEMLALEKVKAEGGGERDVLTGDYLMEINWALLDKYHWVFWFTEFSWHLFIRDGSWRHFSGGGSSHYSLYHHR